MLERIVCEHHVAHQRAGVSPFFDGEQLLLRDKVDRAELGAFTESVAQARSAEAALRMLGVPFAARLAFWALPAITISLMEASRHEARAPLLARRLRDDRR